MNSLENKSLLSTMTPTKKRTPALICKQKPSVLSTKRATAATLEKAIVKRNSFGFQNITSSESEVYLTPSNSEEHFTPSDSEEYLTPSNSEDENICQEFNFLAKNTTPNTQRFSVVDLTTPQREIVTSKQINENNGKQAQIPENDVDDIIQMLDNMYGASWKDSDIVKSLPRVNKKKSFFSKPIRPMNAPIKTLDFNATDTNFSMFTHNVRDDFESTRQVLDKSKHKKVTARSKFNKIPTTPDTMLNVDNEQYNSKSTLNFKPQPYVKGEQSCSSNNRIVKTAEKAHVGNPVSVGKGSKYTEIVDSESENSDPGYNGKTTRKNLPCYINGGNKYSPIDDSDSDEEIKPAVMGTAVGRNSFTDSDSDRSRSVEIGKPVTKRDSKYSQIVDSESENSDPGYNGKTTRKNLPSYVNGGNKYSPIDDSDSDEEIKSAVMGTPIGHNSFIVGSDASDIDDSFTESITLYNNPNLFNKFNSERKGNLMRAVHTARIRKQCESVRANRIIKKLCDSDSDENVNSIKRTLFKDTECENKTTKETINIDNGLANLKLDGLNKPKTVVTDLNYRMPKYLKPKVQDTVRVDTPKFKDILKILEKPKSIDTPKVEKTVNSCIKKAEGPNSFLTFLQSLSENVDEKYCHPDALPYKNNFKKNKDILVKKLFTMYNTSVFKKQLPENLEVIWNERLTKTAGYCQNKRKLISPGQYEHTSRIELSTKILDRPGRVRDTLIHEMCHAASYVIDKEKGGHGPVWKKWTMRAATVFPDLPPIGTKHSYDIVTKFIYQCETDWCGQRIGRHSKSIDTEKFRCGVCKGKFTLLMHKKNKCGGNVTVAVDKSKPQSAYTTYVKENYGKLKKKGMAHGDVMKQLAENYKKKF